MPRFSGFSIFSQPYRGKPTRIQLSEDKRPASPPTKGWLLRAAQPPIPDKSGQPSQEGGSLLEQVKARNVPRGKTGGWLWNRSTDGQAYACKTSEFLVSKVGPC